MRLERFVANALNNVHLSETPSKGFAQSLIAEGDVTINGQVVRENGWHVFMGDGVTCDHVHIRGKPVPIPPAHRLFVMHKPRGSLGIVNRQTRTRTCDGESKAEGDVSSLADLVPEQWWSNDLGMLGRLDKDTTGLCILARSDLSGIGALLLHPSHHVAKTYVSHLAHNNPLCDGAGDGLLPDASQRVEEGLMLADGTQCEPATLEALPVEGRCVCAERLCAFHRHAADADADAAATEDHGCSAYTPVRLTLREGKFHQVKRMLALVGGFGVHMLHRESFGSLSLADMELPVGAMRPMRAAEYEAVQAMLPPSRMCPKREPSSAWLAQRDAGLAVAADSAGG